MIADDYDMESAPVDADDTSDVLSDRLKDYLNNAYRDVAGWSDPHLWNVIELYALLQQRAGLDAPACEIGVHRGRFFIGLANTVRSTRKSLAIDVFDQQEFNIDHSGKGNLEKFMHNVGLYADPAMVEPMTADSLMVGPPEIAAIHRAHGKFALFSIDGGHTIEHTVNDLKIAMQLTAPGGIIFVDDYYNAKWPGVQEGVVRLFTLETPNFVPLCCACGNLMLTDISHHRTYFDALTQHLAERYPNAVASPVRRLGWDTLTVKMKASDPLFSF